MDWRDLHDLDEQTADRMAREGVPPAPAQFTLPCRACNGTGKRSYGYQRITTYPCGICKGSGKVTPERLKNIQRAQQSEQTHEQNLATRKRQFKDLYEREMLWLDHATTRGFEFAGAMLEAIEKYGKLTDNQLAAVQRCMTKEQERSQERKAESQARAVEIDCERITRALNTALGNGLRNPRIRIGAIAFTLAKPSSKNPGCVYIKDTEDYLGKVTPAGKFEPTRACSDELRAKVLEIAADPLDAAQKHGHLTGNCSCCGRPLTNEISTRLGIGPICRRKYGWGE